MRRVSTWMCLLSLCCANLFAAQVIVNDSVDATDLTPKELKLIFAMQKLYWPDGQKIKVFVLPSDSPIHKEFCYQQLELMPYVLRHRWDRLVFSGIGERPTTLASEAEMRARIAKTPGAIGYVSGSDESQAIEVSEQSQGGQDEAEH
ncbi:substrate-binding domain-containing protein [Shewanella marisflavi]|nr:substrate-binding domain-containing protein [Shewanella marisflavi]MCL1040211.1 substrate-binding domain-containing protein [Shewanella marisflavi]